MTITICSKGTEVIKIREDYPVYWNDPFVIKTIQSRETNSSYDVAGVCYCLPTQGDNVADAFQKQTADTPKKHEVIVMGNFNYPDICLKTNSAKPGPSGEFIACLADNFLL